MEADAPVARTAFGAGELLVADCAGVPDANATMIPASNARRFAFPRNDDLLSRNALLTEYKLEVLGPSLIVFVERKPTHAILHAFRCPNFTATRPKLILAA